MSTPVTLLPWDTPISQSDLSIRRLRHERNGATGSQDSQNDSTSPALLAELIDHHNDTGFRLIVESVEAFRYCDEGHLLDYWSARDALPADHAARYSSTFMVSDSNWAKESPLLFSEKPRHFVIATRNEVLEFVSFDTPQFELYF